MLIHVIVILYDIFHAMVWEGFRRCFICLLLLLGVYLSQHIACHHEKLQGDQWSVEQVCPAQGLGIKLMGFALECK